MDRLSDLVANRYNSTYQIAKYESRTPSGAEKDSLVTEGYGFSFPWSASVVLLPPLIGGSELLTRVRYPFSACP